MQNLNKIRQLKKILSYILIQGVTNIYLILNPILKTILITMPIMM